MSKSAKRKSGSSGTAKASSGGDLPRSVERNRLALTGLALGVHLLLCLVMFDPKLHTGGDNAAYVLLARSLLKIGDGYSLNMAPGAPVPFTLYPFGYPLLLALPLALFGKNFFAFKALSTLFSLGSVFIFSLIARRLVTPLIWCGLLFAVALNPIMVEYAHWILTESPFMFFSLLAIYLLMRSEERVGRREAAFWGAVAVTAFACLIRSAGVTLVGAALLYYAFQRNWKRMILTLLGVAVILLPWFIRNRMVLSGGETTYSGVLFMKNPYSPEQGLIDAGGFLKRIETNARIYFLDQTPRTMLASGLKPPAPLIKLSALAVSLLVLIGLYAGLKRRRGIVDFYVLSTLGLALIWPEVWSDIRFVMPVIPFFLLYIAESAGYLFQKAGEKAARNIPVTAIALVAAVSLFSQVSTMGDNLHSLQAYLRGDRYNGYSQNWRDLFEAASWVSDNTPEGSVVCVRKPRLFHLLSDRKAVIYPFTADADSVLDVVLSTDYVVIDAVSGTTFRYLIPALQKQPQHFKIVFNKDYAKVAEVIK